MSGFSGRKVRIKKNGTAIAGARTTNLTINNEPVDITDKGDAGWRTLLADVGVRSVDATTEGVLKDATLINVALGSAASVLLTDITMDIDGLGTFAGDFFLQGLEIGGEQADAITFSGSFQSSGVVTYTAE
jgi:predicted secreted protein